MGVTRLKALFREHGKVAVGLYLFITTVIWAVLLVAVAVGVGGVGGLAAAYVGAKLTQPFRVGATIALTPTVSRLYHRRRRPSGRRAPGVRWVTSRRA